MSQTVRVVIVDDDLQVRRSIRMRFRLERCIDVVGDAPDGPTALALASAVQPDVVLLDLNLDGMNGLDVCRKLAELHIPVVMFSVDDSEQARRRCLASGAAAFVPKRARAVDLVGAILEPHRRFLHPPPAD